MVIGRERVARSVIGRVRLVIGMEAETVKIGMVCLVIEMDKRVGVRGCEVVGRKTRVDGTVEEIGGIVVGVVSIVVVVMVSVCIFLGF